MGDSCLVIGSVEEQTMFDRLTKGEISIPVLPISLLEAVPEAIVEREVS
jgi:monovalent cation:H+ antiporter-2, CPA2 family